MNKINAINYVNAWFKKMTDGEWGHHNGLTIESTDNPGWLFTISFPNKMIENLNHSWEWLNAIAPDARIL